MRAPVAIVMTLHCTQTIAITIEIMLFHLLMETTDWIGWNAQRNKEINATYQQ